VDSEQDNSQLVKSTEQVRVKMHGMPALGQEEEEEEEPHTVMMKKNVQPPKERSVRPRHDEPGETDLCP
jgi:hypothetical protein